MTEELELQEHEGKTTIGAPDGSPQIFMDSDGSSLVAMSDEEARRLVASWNELKNIPLNVLEEGIVDEIIDFIGESQDRLKSCDEEENYGVCCIYHWAKELHDELERPEDGYYWSHQFNDIIHVDGAQVRRARTGMRGIRPSDVDVNQLEPMEVPEEDE